MRIEVCVATLRLWCSGKIDHRMHQVVFFFQADDGIRDAQESRGLGDVYKRQGLNRVIV